MIRFIAIDIDGTLINSEHVITDENRAALKEARDKGIYVTLCTGRMVQSAYDLAVNIGIDHPMVLMNGALIKNPFNDEVVDRTFIDGDTSRRILDILHDYDILPNFYSDFHLYLAQNVDRYKKHFMSDRLDERYGMTEVTSYDQAVSLLEKEGDNIGKFILFPPQDTYDEIRDRLCALEGIEVCSSHHSNIEITGKGATKGKAVRRLAQHLGYNDDEIMVIGDSENDLSMITEFPNSVAMGNAADSVKKAAKYLTSSNDESGVAKAIRQWAL